ncbi:hypothetical protein GIY56_17835 [Paracoccus sp. YIM 132242]|uniref:Uncharacterized protein n=1 Tax=Paracoccus lichenicola TaxID=2665644 RepID=A0A6L6HV32_9RHOB|nr:hypothetical protein [Paracoccus lichenicola]
MRIRPNKTGRWTNGQFERMNRTIKEATVKRFHTENLKCHFSFMVTIHDHSPGHDLCVPARGPAPAP